MSGATTSGNPWLRALVGEAAWAIAHTQDTYLSAFYHRIARRRGTKKAIVALMHKVLVIIYHVLRTKKPYADLGPDYVDQLEAARIERHHVRRLEQLGYTVTLTPKEVAWQRALRRRIFGEKAGDASRFVTARPATPAWRRGEFLVQATFQHATLNQGARGRVCPSRL